MTTSTGQSLTAAFLSKPPLHIPDGNGSSFKTDLVLFRAQDGVVPTQALEMCDVLTGRPDLVDEEIERLGGLSTIKLTWWHGPDPRNNPHNHPWTSFSSFILQGGYTDIRREMHMHPETTTVLKAGDINHCTHEEFHAVTDVLPGTLTLMLCGPTVPSGEWGHLDENDVYTPQTQNPEFHQLMIEQNRFMK